MLPFNVLTLAFAGLSAALGTIVVSENTKTGANFDLTLGDLVINPDTYLEIDDSTFNRLGGSLFVQGSYYIISNSNWANSVVVEAGVVENSGLIAWENQQANLAGRFVVKSIGHFKNSGQIFLSTAGLWSNPVSPFELSSVTDWNNDGLIQISQLNGAQSPVYFRQIGGDNGFNTINNNGNICLQNVIYTQETSIAGSGCINVQEQAQVDLKASLADTVFTLDQSQTIALHTPSSTLSILGLSDVLFNDARVINVAGFGSGNRIEVPFTDFCYDAEQGILTLSNTALFQIDLNIGKGYNSDNFKTDLAFGAATAIWTEDAAPNGIPEQCSCGILPAPPSQVATQS